jgi:hypothetical protein
MEKVENGCINVYNKFQAGFRLAGQRGVGWTFWGSKNLKMGVGPRLAGQKLIIYI